MDDINIYDALKPFSLKNFDNSINSQKNLVTINNMSKEFMLFLLTYLNERYNKKVILISYDEMLLKSLNAGLNAYSNRACVLLEDEDIKFYKIQAYDLSEEYDRLSSLSKISNSDYNFLLLKIGSALKKYEPKSVFLKNQLYLEKDKEYNLTELVSRLTSLGYENVPKVEEKGQFSQRGEILDIYSPDKNLPVRIVFFDTVIESIKNFDTNYQLSVKELDSVKIIQAREYLYDKLPKTKLNELKKRLDKNSSDDLYEEIDQIEAGLSFAGISKYIDFIYSGGGESIFTYIDIKDSIIVWDNPARIKTKYETIITDLFEAYDKAYEAGSCIKESKNILFELEYIKTYLSKETNIYLNPVIEGTSIEEKSETYKLDFAEITGYKGNISKFTDDVKSYLSDGFTVIISEKDSFTIDNYKELFQKENIFAADIQKITEADLSGKLYILNRDLGKGFLLSKNKLMLVCHNDIFYKQNKAQKNYHKLKTASIKSFLDIKKGDIVVHETYGIGRFDSIEQKVSNGISKDFIKIRYFGDDLIYVPISQMDKVQKYVGNTSGLRLTNLSSNQWRKQKNRAKKAVSEIAKYLVELYAAREKYHGYAFSKDTIWQEEFESKFQYEETEDQLSAIEDVKKDMESERPMDRLICGDVGYGKTEVAIRAIFKAAMDSKQSAFLCPTTILAQQHYDNIRARFADYPIVVEVVSRFKTKKQLKEIADKIKDGSIDLLIGTHRLLSKDIQFKNLGLLVIDEEQRFGVKHKELLKDMKKTIDVLTLTATPIPRTLDMALSGVREISLLENPPANRFPIITYVAEAKDSIIVDAVQREIERGGQIFFVHNRVETIYTIRDKLLSLLPDARIAVAHGQMSGNSIEEVMYAYMNKEYDILLCTTIIETGMDISNANTMIIYDADKMGLSQLYQLRGRVGRSSRQAYAFLLYKKDKNLSEVAEARLKTISEFTQFGAGYKIALKDLEIRGAGNILGEKQHGHMQEIGYDLYIKMLNKAIKNLSDEAEEPEIICEVHLQVDAYIPEEYISDETSKMEIYKKIASIEDETDYKNVYAEIEDRFLKIPVCVENLLKISYIKSLAEKLKIEKITQKHGYIVYENSKENFKQGIRNSDKAVITNVVIDFLKKLLYN